MATALTPVRTSGAAADWTARSAWAAGRRLVEITAPVTGRSLVSLTLRRLAGQPGGQLNRGRALRGDLERLGAAGAYGPCRPSTWTCDAGPVRRSGWSPPAPGRRRPRARRGSPRSGPGAADGTCQSTPVGFRSSLRVRLATAVTRPWLACTARLERALGLDQAGQRDRTRGARLDHQARGCPAPRPARCGRRSGGRPRPGRRRHWSGPVRCGRRFGAATPVNQCAVPAPGTGPPSGRRRPRSPRCSGSPRCRPWPSPPHPTTTTGRATRRSCSPLPCSVIDRPAACSPSEGRGQLARPARGLAGGDGRDARRWPDAAARPGSVTRADRGGPTHQRDPGGAEGRSSARSAACRRRRSAARPTQRADQGEEPAPPRMASAAGQVARHQTSSDKVAARRADLVGSRTSGRRTPGAASTAATSSTTP